MKEKLGVTNLSDEMKVKYAGIFMGKISEQFDNRNTSVDLKGFEAFADSLKESALKVIEKKFGS